MVKNSWRLLTAAIGWIGLAIQLFVMLDNTPENGMNAWQAVGRFLIFFTILTNILVALSLSSLILAPTTAVGRFFGRSSRLAGIAVAIFVVGLVYNIVLRPLFPVEGLNRIANEILHVVVPILFVGYWLWFVKKGTLQWTDILRWLVYPGLYLCYALVRGKLEGFYAYPFIDVAKLGYMKVAINAAGVMAAFLVVGFILVTIDKRLGYGSSTLRKSD